MRSNLGSIVFAILIAGAVGAYLALGPLKPDPSLTNAGPSASASAPAIGRTATVTEHILFDGTRCAVTSRGGITCNWPAKGPRP